MNEILVFFKVIFSSFAINEDVFSFVSPEKIQQQLAAGLFVIAFIVIFGVLIYSHKIHNVKNNPEFDKAKKDKK